ncbi:MAG: hypothetical protein KatS3mg121_1299 [Gammaproteobacteria bacterium]|nr:MAG: hypothetical protein KatS3mg121_1299 [Gammaproteobacteria bacterium]
MRSTGVGWRRCVRPDVAARETLLQVWFTLCPEGLDGDPRWASAWAVLLERLAPARRARLLRLRLEAARRRSAFALLLLERVMAALGRSDCTLAALSENAAGKPYWPDGPDFSLSHAGAAVYCAVAAAGRVGVDVERLRADLDPAAFAAHVSAGEVAAAGDFFQAWTAKEAVIKAQGESGVWDVARVRLFPDHADFAGLRWWWRPLPAPAEHRAAVAWDRPIAALDCRAVDGAALLEGGW